MAVYQRYFKIVLPFVCFGYFLLMLELDQNGNDNEQLLTMPGLTTTRISKLIDSSDKRGKLSKSKHQKLRLPDAIIIGAMKAGTTTLQRYIFLHPDVQGRDHG